MQLVFWAVVAPVAVTLISANEEAAAKKSELMIQHFTTPQQWEQWLAINHTSSIGLWLQFYKKARAIKSLTYTEALEIALCYGWIDGQVKSCGVESWLRRFTPRRPKSPWSKQNQEHIARLIAAGRMHAAGLAAVAAAQADGRWQQAISRQNSTMPADFMLELAQHPAAHAHFETLNNANRYAIALRLQTAKKPETRARRIQVLLDMLRQEKKLY